ncbi:MAG: hypothetical protein R6U44_07545 [Archaeoglobaceae archaeon]
MGVSEVELKRMIRNSSSIRRDGVELLEDYYRNLQEQDCEILEDAEIID